MKKIYLVIIITMISMASFSQSKSTSSSSSNSTPTSEISIGVDGGLPIGTFSNAYGFAIGGTVKYAYNFNSTIAATLQSGYISFSGKTLSGIKFPAVGITPIKVGGRYSMDNGIYVEPQLGIGLVFPDATGVGFDYAINVGYRMMPGLDVSARYEGVSQNGTISLIGLRIAYGFALGKK